MPRYGRRDAERSRVVYRRRLRAHLTCGLTPQVPRGSPGVVGQTPLLQPGEAFEYSSGSTVGTPGGSVEGSFQCVRVDDQSPFDARVEIFELIVEQDM